MASIEYGSTGQASIQIQGGQTDRLLLDWQAKDDKQQFDKEVRIIVQHAGSTDGILVRAYRMISTHREQTHHFRIQNESADIYVEGPFSSLIVYADGLSAGTARETVTVTAIARREG